MQPMPGCHPSSLWHTASWPIVIAFHCCADAIGVLPTFRNVAGNAPRAPHPPRPPTWLARMGQHLTKGWPHLLDALGSIENRTKRKHRCESRKIRGACSWPVPPLLTSFG
jgi:hypothetical protein